MIPITSHQQEPTSKPNPGGELNRRIRVEFDDGLESQHGYFIYQGTIKTHEIVFHEGTGRSAGTDGITPEALLAVVQDYLDRHKAQPHYKEAMADVKHAIASLKKH
jgi:hypothetical protein